MQFALKRLTRSDLTFFDTQLRLQNAGKQKAINLNANVFVDLIFPFAREAAAGLPKQFPLPVYIYGPGLRISPHIVTRKVIAAGGTQKNWRLNGETVPDPEDDPTRYHRLAANDLAVFGFESNDGLPSAIYIVLLSESEPPDARPLEELKNLLGSSSMREVPADILAAVAETAPENHPIRELAEQERDQALEDAAEGSAEAVLKLLRRPSSRRMTLEALTKAKLRAEATGRQGEEFVSVWLLQQVKLGSIQGFVWSADANAINPWDFEITELDGSVVRVEVKSTTAGFEKSLHISQAEIIAAAGPNAPRTDLYRVFELKDSSAKLRVSKQVGGVALQILEASRSFGAGIEPDGYSVAVGRFVQWSDVTNLEAEADEEI